MFSHVFIDSANRTNSSDNSNHFEIRLDQPVVLDPVQLISAQIPFNYYNINNSTNRLVVTWNSTDYDVVVDNGNYSLADLASALQSGLQSTVDPGVTCSYNAKQFKFTINFSGATPGTGILKLSTSTMNRLIGFGTVDTSDAASHISTTAAQSMIPSYLFIRVSEIPSSIIASSHKYFGFYVPINVNPGEMITYVPNKDDEQSFKGPQTGHSFNIALTDVNGNLLDINNSDWSMVWKLLR